MVWMFVAAAPFKGAAAVCKGAAALWAAASQVGAAAPVEAVLVTLGGRAGLRAPAAETTSEIFLVS